jgi:MscS family membrane protein
MTYHEEYQQRRVRQKHMKHTATVILIWLFPTLTAAGQEAACPLKPADRSSPRAALKTFLEAGDAVGAFIAQEYLPSPSRREFHRLLKLGDAFVQGLDLSQVPPAARVKSGRMVAMALYVALSRIELPPLEQIPDAGQLLPPDGSGVIRWVIPNTEIALERAPSGPRSGEFLFSTDTVARADEFYDRVQGLPYTRSVPLKNLKELVATGGGWMIPHSWIDALPTWLRAPLAEQAVWKWIGLVLLVGVFALLLRVVYRLSRRGSPQHPVLRAVAQCILPAFFLVGTPAIAYLTLVQLNLRGGVGIAVEMAVTAVMFLAGAWISWRVAPVIAEVIIASPKIVPESIDAHLIRLCTRLLGIIAGAGFLVAGADRLGLPVYGIIAGLGVGGLAIALAAQPTVENLIGGLNLLADRPMRVGDFCQYGTDKGIVEAIGIRSTRFRGINRTLTTIPNAALSRMPVVNFTQRDRMLIQSVISVRYETSPEQLRYLLVKIREMLLGHPRLHPDSAYARFIGIGASSLDIEMFVYVMTSDWTEFLGIREDVLLRVMDIVEESGTGFAFPSQTLYFARDGGLQSNRSQAAEAQVQQWRQEGRLPFPNFTADQVQQMRGTLAYPPPGSSEQPLPARNMQDSV